MSQPTFDATFEDLTEQLGFLKASMDAYDAGNESEAKRLAVTIRVLAYGQRGGSLLEQLDLKSAVRFLSVGKIYSAPSPMNALVSIRVEATERGPSIRYVPIPRDHSGMTQRRWVHFDTWWQEPVVRTAKGLEFSRNDLVLLMANRAGGAHVGKLHPKERVVWGGEDSGMVWHASDQTIDQHVVPPSIRTIATEMNSSLRRYLNSGRPRS